MQIPLNQFQIVIHSLDDSLGFFEHIKDLVWEKRNTSMPSGSIFISSNLNINRQPIVKSCIGGCGRDFPGFKKYACPKCSKKFVVLKPDKK